MRAKCRDHENPGLWFPVQGDGAKEAKQICGGCPVRGQCLKMAIESDVGTGIYGGLAAQPRKRLARRWRDGESLTVLVEGAVSRTLFSTSP
jgi:WhiB family redox-sensing transcriptional regulator